jgi:hypothetical protein
MGGARPSETGPFDTGAENDAKGSLPPPALKWQHERAGAAFTAIWGTGPRDIYAVGNLIAHSTGDGNWTYQDSGGPTGATGVWASGPTDVYISTFSNAILHSAGDGAWNHIVFAAGRTFRDIWGSGPNDVYALSGGATRFKSGMWVEPPEQVSTMGEPLIAIWGSSASDVYIAGAGKFIYHSTGDGRWQAQATAAVYLVDISGVNKNDVYAISGNAVFHSRGDGSWQPQSLPPLHADDGSIPESLISVWALDSSAIYIGTLDGRLLRSGGDGTWLAQDVDSTTKVGAVDGIWGTSPTDLYLATPYGVFHGTAP